MLKIDNLHARIGDTEILKGLSLELGAGEGPCHHGAQRLWKKHPRQHSRRP